ncbi:MoaF N-terminal domain-containing protein [Streptococcaceae bacterium ESL0687]|nr:MoaF N-terminal domain-containing protein [Streptococcaceae bacterium ESL0687]
MVKTFKDLVGKTAEVRFEGTQIAFKLEYLTEDSMRWTALDQDKGNTELEKIYPADIRDGVIAVNWIEKAGASVSHTIDLKEGKVWSFVNWPDDKSYGGRGLVYYHGSFKLTSEL